MSEQVPHAVKQSRSQALKQATDATTRAYREDLFGQSPAVLWEDERLGIWSGLTDTYVRVFCSGANDLHNRITLARITRLDPEGVFGEAA